MATKGKGARQQAVRRARIAAAAEAARRRERRKRWMVVGLAGVLIAAVVLGAVAVGDRGGSASNTKTAGATGSGPPCVAMTDTPPVGAPYVPVHVGAPPAQLVTQELRAGTGPAVAPGDSITVNYIAVACSTGKIFDDSWSKARPATVDLQNVIPGWQQGIPGMQVGGQRLLGIPPSLAYGANPPPGIAANETLWFVVELESINAATTTAPAIPAPATTPSS